MKVGLLLATFFILSTQVVSADQEAGFVLWETNTGGTQYFPWGLFAGSNITLTDRGDGSITVDSAGGGGNSFETIAVPAGASVVADSATDTLTITETTFLTFTGTAATDTIDITQVTTDIGTDGLIAANAVALTTDTTGNYAAGDAEAGAALTGDTATGFFSLGTLEHERGGLEADVSAYDGLIGITGGAAYNQTGTTTQIIIFDGAGAPTSAALSGQATMTNGGVVTVSDVTCTDCLNATEIEDIYVLNASDTMSGTLGVSGLLTASGNLTIGNGATSAGIVAIREDTDAGTNEATFTVPVLAADTDYTLPADDGTDATTELLTTNGAGTLDWITCATLTGSADLCDGTDAGGTDTNADLMIRIPAVAMMPLEAADSIPPIAKDAGTNLDQLVVDFDASTDECRTTSIEMPADITSGGTVTFTFWWYSAAATTGNVIWDVRHNSGVAEGVDPDAALTTEASAADTTQGTAGQVTRTTFTETQTNLGWAANDLVDFVACRDANHLSDDLVGDARLKLITINIPRS